jgi:hypothetical protein
MGLEAESGKVVSVEADAVGVVVLWVELDGDCLRWAIAVDLADLAQLARASPQAVGARSWAASQEEVWRTRSPDSE